MQCLSLSFHSHAKSPRYWPGWRLPECLLGKGNDTYGKCIVAADPRDFRPPEAGILLGAPAKVKRGGAPRITFGELIKMHGYMALNMRVAICMTCNGRSVLSDLRIENREHGHKALPTRFPLELAAKWP